MPAKKAPLPPPMSDKLLSPTESVGPIWDEPLTQLTNELQTELRKAPLPQLNGTPIIFNNPRNYCYRNAAMVLLMYTPQFMSYVQHWHMTHEFPDFPFEDHILQELNQLILAYHSGVSGRAVQAEEALGTVWELFRGESTVHEWEPALAEPEDADQDDSALWLDHLLNEVVRQLRVGVELCGGKPETSDMLAVFRAMFYTTTTSRTRCPGTQDGICPNPNQKQRRELSHDLIWRVRIPDGEGLTLRNCVASHLRETEQRWCDQCSEQKRLAQFPDRSDKAWRRVRDCPEVMFMQLLRFDQNWVKGKLVEKKITRAVEIPATFDMSEFLEYQNYGEGSQVEYELKAVVSHNGNLKRGHYIAHVKVGKKWWRVDDLGGVTESSIERINNDGGGRGGKSKKGAFQPFLMSWVKVRNEILPLDPVRTGQADDAKKKKPAGDDEGTAKSGEEGPGDQGPNEPGQPPSSPSSNDFGDDEWASPGTANITVTLRVGNDLETITIRGKTKKRLGTWGKNPPVFGTIRIMDEKGTCSDIGLANKKGSALREKIEDAAKKKDAEDAAKKKDAEDAAKKKKAEDAAKKKKAATESTSKSSEKSSKRKDAGDDTYVEEGEERPKKKAKRAEKSKAEAKPEDDTRPVTPKAPVRKRKLIRGHKLTPPEEAKKDDKNAGPGGPKKAGKK